MSTAIALLLSCVIVLCFLAIMLSIVAIKYINDTKKECNDFIDALIKDYEDKNK